MSTALEPVYLLAGSDRPKIERALARLRERVGPDAVELLSAREASGADVVAACNSLGLFTEGARLVLVDGVEAWKTADVKAVAAYTTDPAPATVLALVASELKRDSPLAKACAKAGQILVYEVTKRELPRWVAAQFERLGARVEPAAARLLVELAGDDVVALQSEIEKLAAWAGEDAVTEPDVELLVAPLAETPGWALTDSWAKRDVGAVLAACEAMLDRAGGARSGELTRLSGMLGSHVARLRECQLLAEEGVSAREAAGRLRRSPYYVSKLFEQAERVSAAELQDATARLAALDLALKGGSKLPGELELARALVDVTSSPARAGA